jgi:hypothetical protein
MARLSKVRYLLLAILAAPMLAAAQTARDDATDWQVYTNTRYGVSVDYPADVFLAQPPPFNNAGRDFKARHGTRRFYVLSHANALDQSIAGMLQEAVDEFGTANIITKALDLDGYVIEAGLGNERVHRRVITSEQGSMVHILEIAYPAAEQPLFGAIAERMSRSFRKIASAQTQ